MMHMLSVLLLFISLTATGNCQQFTTNSQEFVDHLNNMNTTWIAQLNFPNLTDDQLPHCADMIPVNASTQEVPLRDMIPTEFDARVHWNRCPTIQSIYNQGQCGSCWTFGTSEAMSDRICISCGETNIVISPQNILNCCGPRYGISNGCNGGPINIPYQCWITYGIVTDGCQAYTQGGGGMPPPCSETCSSGFGTPYSSDLYYGKTFHQVPSDVASIQSEIMTNGPITVMFQVFQDFYNYRSGVYQHVGGAFVGYHAVKMIGWGVENGTPFWLLANSWGTGWADLGGFFKVLRGVNEVRIETWPFAGTPACMSRPGVATSTSGAASFNKDSQMLMMSLVIMSLLGAKVTHCI